MIAIAIALVGWYSSRPKPWNTRAIKGSFDRLYITGSPNHFVFDYILENPGDADYNVDVSELQVLAKLHQQNSLAQTDATELTLTPTKFFIPAKQRIRATIDLIGYGYHEKKDGIDFMPDPPDYLTTSQLERHAFTAKLKTYLNNALPNLDGYRIFDSAYHYEYDLPKGW